MRKVVWVAFCFLLAGCGASQPVPDWLNASHSQLEAYQKNYLSGSDKLAALRFKGAINDIKKSGDLEMLARAYLIRMALQRAVLEEPDAEDYLKIAALQSMPTNRNYYAFLKGEPAQVDEKLLPAQYQGLLNNLRPEGEEGRLAAIGKMQNPLSQLIAMGVLVYRNQESEALLQRAVAVASAQGWKKALLAYLERLRLYYEGKPQKDKALEIEQRIMLITN